MSAKQIVQVAIAVIYHGDRYLLGFRDASQHQGNLYEFVGGKIEDTELPLEALIREIKEEVGVGFSEQISTQVINKLGILTHAYSYKSVQLHVYRVHVDKQQYDALANKERGAENQKIVWVSKSDLMSGKYPLPTANAAILQWLTLDDTIAITYSIDDFQGNAQSDFQSSAVHKIIDNKINKDSKSSGEYENDTCFLSTATNVTTSSNSKSTYVSMSSDFTYEDITYEDIKHNQPCRSWLDYHCHHLPIGATVYLRHKMQVGKEYQYTNQVDQQCEQIIDLIQQLCNNRPDLSLIISASDLKVLLKSIKYHPTNTHWQVKKVNEKSFKKGMLTQIVAQHLTHSELMQLINRLTDFNSKTNKKNTDKKEDYADDTSQATNTSTMIDYKVELASILTANMPIIVSCHHELSIKAANKLADLCLACKFASVIGIYLSPVLPTKTHPDSKALGWDRFSQLARLSKIPVIALGGLLPQDLEKVRQYGGDKVAGIRAFMLKSEA